MGGGTKPNTTTSNPTISNPVGFHPTYYYKVYCWVSPNLQGLVSRALGVMKIPQKGIAIA
ncbi:hypothetical protein APPUASWS_016485 [Arthrospira platensis str. Paraca]|nr:hypothetical protein APPUASWS_016475 [Arthrospira platensis str. Paraca]KDR56437.1 hypothetical protein APPUASWS_016480 [Arthrospira platensis str. Paraca]KDR56438.1 hypothetical protein APPUASWS_016485 [Arthrospira platensis str. Paraca]